MDGDQTNVLGGKGVKEGVDGLGREDKEVIWVLIVMITIKLMMMSFGTFLY